MKFIKFKKNIPNPHKNCNSNLYTYIKKIKNYNKIKDNFINK